MPQPGDSRAEIVNEVSNGGTTCSTTKETASTNCDLTQLLFLTEQQAAVVFPRSRFWFQKKRWKGDGPAYVKVDKRVFYEKQVLIDWFRRHQRTSTTRQARPGAPSEVAS